MTAAEKAMARRRRFYRAHKAEELARCKVYRETKLPTRGRPVPCPVPGWGTR